MKWYNKIWLYLIPVLAIFVIFWITSRTEPPLFQAKDLIQKRKLIKALALIETVLKASPEDTSGENREAHFLKFQILTMDIRNIDWNKIDSERRELVTFGIRIIPSFEQAILRSPIRDLMFQFLVSYSWWEIDHEANIRYLDSVLDDAIESKDERLRLMAAELCSKTDNEKVKVNRQIILSKALRDSISELVRATAAQSTAQLGSDAGLRVATALLISNNPDVQLRALRTLALIDSAKAKKDLYTFHAEHLSKQNQMMLLAARARNGIPVKTDEMVTSLHDSSLMAVAIEALGFTTPKDYLNWIFPFTRSEDERIYSPALWAIAQKPGTASRYLLLDAARNGTLRKKRMALRELSTFPEKDIELIADSLIQYLKEPDYWIKTYCGNGLSKIPDRSIPALVNVFRDTNDLKFQKEIAKLLSRMENEKAIGFYIDQLTHKEKEIQEYCVAGLEHTQSSQVNEKLLQILNGYDFERQRYAAFILGHRKDQRAKERLKSLLKHPDDILRFNAKVALENLEGKSGMIK